MNNAKHKITFMLLLLFVVVYHSGLANADSPKCLTVPIDLNEYALRQNCTPVDDFYVRRGVTVPPYVYAEVGGPEPAAALWCREKKGGRTKYILLFRPGDGSVGQGTCPPRIPDQEHIGGLSLLYKSDLKLDQFRFISTPALSGPPSQPLKEIAIKSEYDGVGSIYYCHEGKWLKYIFD